MAESTLVQVRHLVDELSPLEQVRLLEYLTPRIVHAISSQQAVLEGLESQLSTMADDPDIQRELRRIEAEFSGTEADGLLGVA